ncbi:hypothetical protein ANAEL_00996 [Anaerolineales bacterium]|nr:hypothetical protein ANAEL_00996 [Anaerolineales bacterium]
MKRTGSLIALLSLLFLGLSLLGVYWTLKQTPPNILASDMPTPLSTFKDLFLVTASGILTLCSAYLGAFIQSTFQQQEKRREERREITQPYKDYLLWVMQIGQLARLIKTDQGVRGLLPQNGKKHDITSETFDEVLSAMPLWWGYSAFSEGPTREKVFDAMYASIQDLMDIYSPENAPEDNALDQKYLEALSALEEYERS